MVITALCLLAYRLAAEDRAERVGRELENFERSFMRRVWEKATDSKPDTPPTTEDIRAMLAGLNAASDLPHFMRGLFDPNATESVYLCYWDHDGNVLFRSANAPADLVRPTRTEIDDRAKRTSHGLTRELIRRGPRGFHGIVGRDISPDVADLRTMALQISGLGAGLWLFGLIGGWWLSGRAIRPIEKISRTASRITNGNVSERIDIPDTDNELGRLSRVLNDTFDRLESAIHQQRQFTADASHELRTPLTVILSETSRGLKRDRPAEEYRDILSTTRDAAERMRSLVESLLVLARQDGNSSTLTKESCDLTTIVSDAVKLLRPLADERQIRIEPQLAEVSVHGDSRSLSMVVVNLLSNAIHHQDPGGSVTLRLSGEEGRAVLEVKDTGKGISPEHLPHLFDRFYRVDPARAATGGHSGLGLAIVKAIVDNHDGTIDVTSAPGEGTVFRVSLPKS
ncbi:ATP-binding protein [Luteolibacter sp. SL250]|uniref:sensor histidine kinase n=1 Tax=Luteolibacter sp. SL250 TaxID=2995170 RepID=UPI00226DD836|nr:ATP-binding protein [Luteolibacter sp. SL250]WAC21590.1 ATP-binding protein [Luteolibacter sp. SL250]